MAGVSTIEAQAGLRKRLLARRRNLGDGAAYVLTLLFATLILILTALVLYELFAASHLSRARFGFSFVFSRSWNPVTGQFGALPFIYGTVVTSLVALVIGAAGGGSERHLRLAGAVCAGAAAAESCRAVAEEVLWISTAVSRASPRGGAAGGWGGARDYGGSVHYFRFPGVAAGGSARAAGGSSGAGSDAVGGDLECGSSLCTLWDWGRYLSGACPSFSGDDGRDHGDR